MQVGSIGRRRRGGGSRDIVDCTFSFFLFIFVFYVLFVLSVKRMLLLSYSLSSSIMYVDYKYTVLLLLLLSFSTLLLYSPSLPGMPTDFTAAKALAAELFIAVRKGFIIGRIILEPENGVPLRYPYDAIPENEYSFPEFVEATARAGYYKWSGHLSIAECFMTGINAAVDTLKKEISKK